MPAGPRYEIIDEDEVGIYHCYHRCVRRAYLMGNDDYLQKNFDHRKDWLYELLRELAGSFAIDVCKYGILDNHLHLMLKNRPDLVRKWSDENVLRRAMRIFGPTFRRKYVLVEPHETMPNHLLKNKELVAKMRKRLSSISWLMKTVCERIARRANKEDGVTGTFWDGRFKCERLLDDAAVLACAMYIDLNVTRARKAKTPERSKYTSAYDRIQGLRARRRNRKQQGMSFDGWLCPLNTMGDYSEEDLAKEGMRASNDGILEMPLTIYLKTLDTVGREMRTGKRGAIPAGLPPILERLGIADDQLVNCVLCFGTWKGSAVGKPEHLREEAKRKGRHWLHGISRARKIFVAPDPQIAN